VVARIDSSPHESERPFVADCRLNATIAIANIVHSDSAARQVALSPHPQALPCLPVIAIGERAYSLSLYRFTFSHQVVRHGFFARARDFLGSRAPASLRLATAKAIHNVSAFDTGVTALVEVAWPRCPPRALRLGRALKPRRGLCRRTRTAPRCSSACCGPRRPSPARHLPRLPPPAPTVYAARHSAVP